MHADEAGAAALVAAAQAGDEDARERLIAAHLPLVYNVVGRAMGGDADVDDVVQETMVRVIGSLAGLRDPSSFRSWLVAIAMNEVRRRWAARQLAPLAGLDTMEQLSDPAGDFVDVTILRLGLSGQRREVAEATRWLDERERDLLSLWWLETAGELTRAELVEALGIPAQHAAVRVQRMKEQLEVGRLVVRALDTAPPCPGLSALTPGWDGRPAALWRKRIARHARACAVCSGHRRELLPVEGLLAGLVLVLPPQHLAAHTFSSVSASVPASVSASASAPPSGRRLLRGGRRPAQLVGGVVAAVAVLGAVSVLPSGHPAAGAGGTALAVVTPAEPSTEPTPTPTPMPTPSPTPSPSLPSAPPSTPAATVAPAPSPTPSVAPKSLERQLVDLINAQRTKAGCAQLRIDPRLHAAAQGHSADMVANHYFDHADPQGGQPDARITAAGYQWSAWGENLDQDTKSPAKVLSDWMDGAIHQQNLLDCRYTDTGVGTAPDSGGLVWTLDLAAPL